MSEPEGGSVPSRHLHGVKESRTWTESRRSRLRALTDAALIDAMRDGVPEAWTEFDARFRPLLERYAARVGIPRWDWSVCITEVLDDEALRLVERGVAPPQHMTAYLVRAVRNRFLELKRATLRRDRRYADAAALQPVAGGAIAVLISEHTRRASDTPRVAEERVYGSNAVRRFAQLISASLSDQERQLLAWVSEGVPRRLIAEWLGVTREAAKKRVSRLCHRVRALAVETRERLPAEGGREIDRLLRRASRAPEISPSGDTNDR